jgi:diguanylate cyclase (GGDEF)-like protein/PAS domain S-box-containing protein/putative nucleotidyltransferase with HDIG domain
VDKYKNIGKPIFKNIIRLFTSLYAAWFIMSGIFLAYFWFNSIADIKRNALTVAEVAARSLDVEAIYRLKGTPEDLGTENYESVKNSLAHLADSISGARFVYLLTEKENKIIIMADSEPPDSSAYSPPGQVYSEAPASFFQFFSAETPTTSISTVIKDRWGKWKTITVPLDNPDGSRPEIAFNVDYPTWIWYDYAVRGIGRGLFLIFITLLLITASYALVSKNKQLRQEQELLKAARDEAEEKRKTLELSQVEIKNYSKFQETLLDISTVFSDLDSENINTSIQKALKKVAKAVDADSVYVFEYDFKAQTFSNTHEWQVSESVSRNADLQNVPLSLMEEWPYIHISGKPVCIPDVRNMPEDGPLKQFLLSQNIIGLLTVPMLAGSDCRGFIGFDNITKTHFYSEAEMRLLAQFSNLLILTLDRVRLYKDLGDNEEKYRNIFEHCPAGIFNFDKDCRIIDCNDIFVNIAGTSKENLLGYNMLASHNHHIADCIKRAIRGEVTEYRGEYHSRTADKSTPILGKAAPIFSSEGEIIGGTGIVEDITERKKLGDELRLKSMVLDQLEEFVAVTDLNGNINYVNKVHTQFFKFRNRLSDKQKENFCEEMFIDSGQNSTVLEYTIQGGTWRGEISVPQSDSEERFALCRIQVVSNEKEEPVALCKIGSDITERKIIEQELSKEKEQFKTTLLSVGDGVIATDAKGCVTVINAVAEKLLSLTNEQAVGKPLDEIMYLIDEDSGQRVETPVKKVLKTGKTYEFGNHTIMYLPDDTGRYIEDSTAPIRDSKGRVTGVVMVFRDVTQKITEQRYIEYLNIHDQLTGLYNRRYYQWQVAHLASAEYYPLALIMLDVNGLKITNDAFGHEAGDTLLLKFAAILKELCREEDVLARIGGDEFVMLMPKTDEAAAEIAVKNIHETIEQKKGEVILLSASIGYAVKYDDEESINDVFMKAEDAMYINKLTDSSYMCNRAIDLIMNSLFAKSEHEMFHSKRVGDLCESIAEKMGFSALEVEQTRLAGLMHDIGKIGIRDEVLNKAGKLTEEEFKEIRRHSEIGYRILCAVNEFSSIAGFVFEHHERVDGKGFPRGLTAEEISPQAKVITVADAYDAMMNSRPYREALTQKQAIEEIKNNAGTQFDEKTARVFVEKVLGLEW